MKTPCIKKPHRLRKSEFYTFLNNYKPSCYEQLNENDSRYDLKKHTLNYAIISRDRLYYSVQHSLSCFTSRELKILDLGAYPGTFLRILQQVLRGYTLDLWAAGMNMTPEFVRIMHECGIRTFTVNLDPENSQLKNKNYPHSLSFEDNSFDFISALEIVEHLSSPFHMLSEARRLLKKGGKLLITTPNISRIGSVFKLLLGKSNLEGVVPVNYFNENDEWRPHVREYSMEEMGDVLAKCGFTVRDKVFFNSNLTYFNVKNVKQKLIDLVKVPFSLVPHFKEHLLITGEKVCDAC